MRTIGITLTADDRGGPACDFCGAPDPVWLYPCASFDLPQPYSTGSVGDWSACDACAAIIETVPLPIEGNPAAGARMADLAKRAIDRVHGGERPPGHELMAFGVFLFHLHGGFFKHRQGPRRRAPGRSA